MSAWTGGSRHSPGGQAGEPAAVEIRHRELAPQRRRRGPDRVGVAGPAASAAGAAGCPAAMPVLAASRAVTPLSSNR